MGVRLQMGVRPVHLTLTETEAPGEVLAVEPLGAETHRVVRWAGSICAQILPASPPSPAGTPSEWRSTPRMPWCSTPTATACGWADGGTLPAAPRSLRDRRSRGSRRELEGTSK
jgi:hypothetical protein